jgi:threonine/homoserine efflux transporter RhtA
LIDYCTSKRNEIAEILSCTVIRGSIPIFAIQANLTSPVFIFFRVAISAVFLALIFRKNIKKSIGKTLNPHVTIPGMLLVLNLESLFYAVFLIPVLVAITYYTGPVIAILLSPFIKKK